MRAKSCFALPTTRSCRLGVCLLHRLPRTADRVRSAAGLPSSSSSSPRSSAASVSLVPRARCSAETGSVRTARAAGSRKLVGRAVSNNACPAGPPGAQRQARSSSASTRAPVLTHDSARASCIHSASACRREASPGGPTTCTRGTALDDVSIARPKPGNHKLKRGLHLGPHDRFERTRTLAPETWFASTTRAYHRRLPETTSVMLCHQCEGGGASLTNLTASLVEINFAVAGLMSPARWSTSQSLLLSPAFAESVWPSTIFLPRAGGAAPSKRYRRRRWFGPLDRPPGEDLRHLRHIRLCVSGGRTPG